ncbi:MAG: glycosyltransferase family 2 protein [Candidatus Altiarchaeales archaeon]|nr:glycosyltransferase family 2 protein [Candidatus Altiarchaeota archaeon]MBU4266569.1 glycosyltransferase family 2 protein [Candidatus Altiarchaeota archaeon]MBU4341704.1 glycosyltransferase family 2 protein [Candidatus Altiarchaeota archaeon]MBU4437308.1 glycosyltransferase family 2 protein [Candidatus Altiarchaeota archaeon]MCG2783411.1 glycosyltransferase family 2 protein [Candidatus Altiarchaeales archaeon]
MIDLILIVIFSVLIVLHGSWIFLLLYPERKKYDEISPDISIIMPAHNEEGIIESTINSVLEAEYSGKREIIVVNDGSSDRTAEIVRGLAEKDERIRLYETNHVGKAKAINRGVENATNEIVVVLDADSMLDSEALVKIVKPFSDKRVGGVSGIIRAIQTNNPLTWFQDLEYIVTSGWRYTCNRLDSTYIFPGFAAFRKGALLETGGFSSDTLSEDFEIGLRLRKEGHVLVMSWATIYTKVPETFSGLMKQRIRWGRGTIQVIRKHFDVPFNKKYGAIGFYGIPTQMYWFIHGLTYLPVVFYQILSGYLKYFVASDNSLSLEAAAYFFRWFSFYGMVDFTYKTFIGEYEMSLVFVLTLVMFCLYILYDALVITKIGKPSVRFLFVIFFLFPYSLFVLSLHVVPLFYELLKPGSANVWEKNK